MNKDKAKTKDKLLCYLCEYETGSMQVSEIANKLNISHDLVFTLMTEFEERGFVRSIETSSKDANRRDKAIIIESHGRVFINDGGYTEEEKEKRKAGRKASITTSLDNVYKVVAIIGVIGTIGIGLFSYNLNEKVLDLEKNINGLMLYQSDSLDVESQENPIYLEVDSSSISEKAR